MENLGLVDAGDCMVRMVAGVARWSRRSMSGIIVFKIIKCND